MDRADYLRHDAVGLADLVRQGEVTPGELAAVALAQHEHTHATINAVVEWYDPESVPAPNTAGPLGGVPFLRKDIGSTEAGRLVEMGSRLAVGLRAEATSPYFERMAGAGVQVLGRTAVPEFAQHGTTESDLFGATRNPLDPTVSAGGSSGGAAAAVRAGVVPVAHASDSAGSIRIPAAVTGLIGLKPSRGRVPGCGFDWNGLLVELVVARSIRDVAACLVALTGAQPGAVGEGADRRCRIALSLDHWAGGTTEPAVTAATVAAARALEAAGHEIEPIGRPFDYERLMSTWFPLFGAGIAELAEMAAQRTGRPATPPNVEPVTEAVLERVAALPDGAREEALATGVALAGGLHEALAGFDAILTPTLDRVVIPLERMGGHTPMDAYLTDGDEWFSRLYLADVVGWPAVSVPAPVVGPHPVGVQLMAAPGGDELLLTLAGDVLRELPGSDAMVVPPLSR